MKPTKDPANTSKKDGGDDEDEMETMEINGPEDENTDEDDVEDDEQ